MKYDNTANIQFPKTPDKLQFVTFLKNKLSSEDIKLDKETTLTEAQIRETIAESIFSALFIGRINERNEQIDTLVVKGTHILKYIRDGYPELRHVIEKIQSKENKNIFGNKDIIDKANKAKEKGFEPLAKLLAKGNIDKDEFEMRAKNFVGRVATDKLEDNMQKLDEAIEGAQDIVIASALFDEGYRTAEIEDISEREMPLEFTGGPKREWNKIDIIGTREHMIECQNESLVDLFSKTQEEVVNSILREPFIKHIEKTVSPRDAEYIKKNFKIKKYERPKLKLATVGETNFNIFEDNYVEIFYSFLRSGGREAMDYSISTEEVITNKEKATTQKIIKKGSLEPKTGLDHRWDTFVGDKLKDKVKDFALKGRHLYIEGVPGSGKTHLLQGLATELHQIKPSENIIYKTGIAFYNEYQLISAENRATKAKPSTETGSKKKKSEYVSSYADQFRGKIFIVDGVEGIFSGGKRLLTKEAFLAACQNAKQVIMSGRCSPGALVIPRDENPIKISDEIKNIQDIDMPIPKVQANNTKKSIIYNIFAELGDLFTQGLPLEGMANILVDHVPPNDYKRTIEGYLVARELQVEDWNELSIKKYIERKLKLKEIGLPIEDIISTIYDLLREENVRETIPGVKRGEIDSEELDKLMAKIRSDQVKSDSTLYLFRELIIHFIHKGHPDLTQIELGAIIGKPSTGGSTLRSAEKREEEYPLLFGRIETGLTAALYKKYGLPPESKK